MWLVLGATYALALVAAASIGLFVLPFAVVGTAFVARCRGARAGVPGLVAGLGLPLLYVAYLNRAGPGPACTALRGGGQRCIDVLNPWPWAGAGAALIVVGALAFNAGRTSGQRAG